MKFYITIIIYKLIILKITPFIWRIIPTWKKDYSIGKKKEVVWIKYPWEGGPTGRDYGTRDINRRVEIGFVVKWLCFSLQFTYMEKVEEVENIYPAKYDYDSDPHWREKYQQLINTGYFN